MTDALTIQILKSGCYFRNPENDNLFFEGSIMLQVD